MNLQDLKKKKPPELLAFAEELGVESAGLMRQQELMFAILQKLAADRPGHLRRRASSKCCRTASASCARPRPTTCPAPTTSTSARPGAPLWPAHRRHGGRRDPRAQGRRALLRPGQGQQDQLRRSRGAAPSHQLRQPDAALSRREAQARDGRQRRRHGAGRQGRRGVGSPASALRRAASAPKRTTGTLVEEATSTPQQQLDISPA